MDCKINATWLFLIFLTLSFLFIPLKLFLSWITASFVHELFHLIALRILRYKVQGIGFSVNGIKIESEPAVGIHKLICLLAGPIGSFLLIIFLEKFPLLAICGALQGVYNILPFFPLDGWHILNLLQARCVKFTIRIICCIALLVTAIYLLFHSAGALPLCLVLLILRRDMKNTLQLAG